MLLCCVADDVVVCCVRCLLLLVKMLSLVAVAVDIVFDVVG